MPRSRWLLPLAAAAIFLLLVLINGYPLLYDDTTAYMRRSAGALVVFLGPEFGSEWTDPVRLGWLQESVTSSAAAAKEQVPPWTSGRSVYYGVVVYLLARMGDLWAPAAFQALVAGILIYLAWFKLFRLRSVPLFVAACVLLTFATSLGFFVGLIMPDVFAGFAILSFALLLFGWNQLNFFERLVAGAIGAFAVLAHDTHLLLAAGLFALALPAAFWLRGEAQASKRGTAVIGACLAIGLAGSLVYNQAALAVTGQPPLRLPHLTAHIASLPEGAAFLRDRCSRENWTVCAHTDKLPTPWTEFMFGKSKIYDGAPIEQRRQLSEQQIEIAGAMLTDRPATMAGLAATEAWRQLASFTYYDLGQREILAKDMPQPVRERMKRTLLVGEPQATGVLSRVQQVAVVFSLAALVALMALASRARRSAGPLFPLSLFVLAGIVLNAVICGVLASPYDRFQTRVVWLIPLLALLWAAHLVQGRSTPASARGWRLS